MATEINSNPTFLTIADLPAAGARTGAEKIEVIQEGQSRQMSISDATKFDRYDLSVNATTGVCDLATSQAFTISNTATGSKTLSFTNAPAGRSLVAVLKIAGKTGTIVWPAGITWNNSTAPELGATSTIVILFWDGTSFTGSQGATV